MNKTTTILVALLLSTGVYAVPGVNISGMVTATDGTPLSGVVMTLKNVNGISAETDSKGKFLLSTGTQVHFQHTTETLLRNFELKGATVVLSFTAQRVHGTVGVFSVTGKRIIEIRLNERHSSKEQVLLREFVPGLNIIRINSNGNTIAMPILRVGKKLYYNGAHARNPAVGNTKSFRVAGAAVNDTLIARKDGFTDKKYPISTYIDSNIVIVLKSVTDKECTPPAPGTKLSNPIFTDVYTADPAVMVDNCTFYIACGHDQGQRGFDLREWFLLKSTDMVNWTRSTPMTLKTFSWTNVNAWAGQMIKGVNGKYYWYVPINDIKYSKDRMAIGVAVADNPEGPWKDALGKPLINDALEMETWGITNIDQTPHTIDPTVFIDDDKQAYLQYGGFWKMVTVKLNPDMISLAGELKMTTPHDYFESPYLIKRNDIYYEIYARGSANPTSIDYATSDSPMGPWKHRGTILPKMPKVQGQDEPTNHAAVAEFAGEWYIVYHISNGPNGGGTYKRQVAIDKLTFNNDGTINPVTPSKGITF